jgi:formyl-CoA transferase
MSVLDGVRVLDVGHLTSGPLTSWLLGSLGADVIKIEPPHGDGGRTNLSPSEDAGEEGGYYFHSTNTDKRSVVLDMKSETGRSVLFDLVAEADVLVENYRPGTMEGMGVGQETLRDHNPELVYCSITGYGEDNDSGGARAYDSILQARSGIMTATGYSTEPPTKTGVSLIDNLGSYVAAVAVLGALYHRDATGEGQYLDISMQDCAAWIVQSLLPFETERTPHQPTTEPFAVNGVFETADGWILVSAPDDAAEDAVLELLGDAGHGGNLEAALAEWAATAPTDDLLEACDRYGVPASRIADIEALLDQPQVDGRNAFAEVESAGRTYRVPVSPYCTALSGGRRPERPGPALGEHTEAVLSDLLGYDADEVEDLVAEANGE